MPSPAFEIASFEPYPAPRPISGAAEVALFRLRYGCLDIHGASLLHRDDGSFAVLLPKAGRGRRVVIDGPDIRRALIDTLAAVYAAYAGSLPPATAPSESSEHSIDR